MDQRISKILDDKWLTNNGSFVQQFETALAAFCGVKHCVAVTNGTVGLELSIKALAKGTELILPSFTFVASAHAARWHGLKPVFCDIDPQTLCLNPDHANSLVNEHTGLIMGVHVYGHPCDTDRLKQVALSNDLPLIYDAAHAFGCTRNNQMIGGFGTCEVFSFHATKVLNSIEGGAITTNNGELANRLRRLRNFGFPGDGGDSTVDIGTNAKMNEICAAVGLTNLESLDAFITVNKSNYLAYLQGLTNIPGISLFPFNPLEKNNYQYVILLVDRELYGIDRDQLCNQLTERGVIARRYFYPGCHMMQPYLTEYPNSGISLPVTEQIAQQVLALPTGAQLSSSDIESICEMVRQFRIDV